MYQVNFCAGPAQLPKHVYSALAQMIQNYQGTGLSLLSLSHRDSLFAQINDNIKKYLSELLTLTDGYEILLMPAGASGQFAAIPMNLKHKGKALYIDSGYWAKAAINEGKKFIEVDVLNGVDLDLTHWNGEYDYVHYTENETIDGLQWSVIPEAHLPLICDMSSSFLSKPVDITRYGLVYAGAQKNIGLPGVTIVILNKALLKGIKAHAIPGVLSYQAMQKADSLYNTPDMIAWAAMELVLADLIQQGGLKAIADKNAQKAQALYQAIDQSRLFINQLSKAHRSTMNVVFQLNDETLTKAFLRFADQNGVYGIAGHRSVGGVRVSLYNAIKMKEVETLIALMKEFEQHAK